MSTISPQSINMTLENKEFQKIVTSKWDMDLTKYSTDVCESFKRSLTSITQIFSERNIKTGTQKGYIAALLKWFEYTNAKYISLDEAIQYYFTEEDQHIPLRERTIKKDLIGFREYLINDNRIKSNNTIKTYFSKIRTIFNHYEVELPRLPSLRLDKEYVSNFNELPTHNMIRTAVDQSELIYKAIFLFMSSSGSAKAETLSITTGMFLQGCKEYIDEDITNDNIHSILKSLKGQHNIIPVIYLCRLKTDKYYYTCCTPEAAYYIIEYLNTRKDIGLEDKLFDINDSQLFFKFQKINDLNNWGFVGKYRRFRSHALRKFMASNIGLSRDQVDLFQGRSKDMVGEAYFKDDPQQLKKLYMEHMHKVMIFNNWGYPVEESLEPLIEDNETVSLTNTSNIPMIQGNSIAKELLMYSRLLDKGLLSMEEFTRLKTVLLKGVLY